MYIHTRKRRDRGVSDKTTSGKNSMTATLEVTWRKSMSSKNSDQHNSYECSKDYNRNGNYDIQRNHSYYVALWYTVLFTRVYLMQRDRAAAVCCAYVRKVHCAYVRKFTVQLSTWCALWAHCSVHQWILPVNRTRRD